MGWPSPNPPSAVAVAVDGRGCSGAAAGQSRHVEGLAKRGGPRRRQHPRGAPSPLGGTQTIGDGLSNVHLDASRWLTPIARTSHQSQKRRGRRVEEGEGSRGGGASRHPPLRPAPQPPPALAPTTTTRNRRRRRLREWPRPHRWRRQRPPVRLRSAAGCPIRSAASPSPQMSVGCAPRPRRRRRPAGRRRRASWAPRPPPPPRPPIPPPPPPSPMAVFCGLCHCRPPPVTVCGSDGAPAWLRDRRRRVARTAGQAPAQARRPCRGTPGGLSNLSATPPPPLAHYQEVHAGGGPTASPGGLSQCGPSCAAPLRPAYYKTRWAPASRLPTSLLPPQPPHRCRAVRSRRTHPHPPIHGRGASARAVTGGPDRRRRSPRPPRRCGADHPRVESAVAGRILVRRGAPPPPLSHLSHHPFPRYHGGWG